jgi:hypothetical protein
VLQEFQGPYRVFPTTEYTQANPWILPHKVGDGLVFIVAEWREKLNRSASFIQRS